MDDPSVLDALDGLRRAPHGVRLIATSRISYGRAASVLDPVPSDTLSRLFINLGMREQRLNPRDGDWTGVIRGQLSIALARCKPLKGIDVHPLWATVFEQLTGGHPALLTEAFRALYALVDGARDSQTPFADRRDQGDYTEAVCYFLRSSLTSRGIPAVERAVRQIRQENPEAYELLVNVASKDAESDDTPAERTGEIDPHRWHKLMEVIKDSGLAYEDLAQQSLRIPGQLVKEAILHSAREVRARVLDVAIRSESQSDDAGAVTARTATCDFEVLLTGTPWRILQIIGTRSEPTSVAHLAEELGLSESAVRSGVQRLQRTLEDNGLHDAIQNEYGRGYVLSGRATWQRK